MMVKAGGGDDRSEGGRGKSIKYKTEWGYWGAHPSGIEWCEVFSTHGHRRLPELHELSTV